MKKTINLMNDETRKLITDLRLHYIKRDNLLEQIRYDCDRLDYEESLIPGLEGRVLSPEKVSGSSPTSNPIEEKLLKVESIRERLKTNRGYLNIVSDHLVQANKILSNANEDYQKILFKKYAERKKNWVIAQETCSSLGNVKKIISNMNKIFFEDMHVVNEELDVLTNNEIKKL